MTDDHRQRINNMCHLGHSKMKCLRKYYKKQKEEGKYVHKCMSWYEMKP